MSTQSACNIQKTPDQTGNPDKGSSNSGQATCTPPLYEVVHITGERNQFYALTHQATEELNTAWGKVRDLMVEFSNLVKSETEDKSSPQSQAALLKKRLAWLGKASDAGLLAPQPERPPEHAVFGTPYEVERNTNIESCTAELGQLSAKRNELRSRMSSNGQMSRNNSSYPLTQLKLAELEVLESKMQQLQTLQQEDLCHPTSILDEIYSVDTLVKAGGNASGNFTIVEFQRFSAPDQLYYLPLDVIQGLNKHTNGWIPVKLSSASLQSFSTINEDTISLFAELMIDDFKKQLKPDFDVSELANLPWFINTKGNSWESPTYNPLNALHLELFPKKVIEGEFGKGGPAFAFSAEAQALRFAAGANLGKVEFKPSQGKIKLSASAEAKYSLFEGEASAELILPSKEGQQIYVSFRGADKQERLMEFGYMRFDAKLLLSVFAGVRGNMNAKLDIDAQKLVKSSRANSNAITTQTSREIEQSAGAGLLLIPKAKVETKKIGHWTEKVKSNGKAKDSGACVGLSAEGFAGVEGGAALTLHALWKAPESHQPSTVEKEGLIPEISSTEFVELAKTGYQGSLKAGVGAGGHLKINWEGGKFILYIHASAAWGFGFSGGFEVAVDKENILKVFYIVLEALQQSDYRDLTFVDEETFLIMARGLYKVMLLKDELKKKILMSLFANAESAFNELETWWRRRSAIQDDIEALARNINNDLFVINPSKLPPETVGPMLYSLSFSFIFSFEEDQETAIMNILNKIHSWRHFMQILKRMSEKGDSVDMYQSMQQLCSILDGAQYLEFITWTTNLKVVKPQQTAENPKKPFTPLARPIEKRKNSEIIANIESAWNVKLS
ncbi:hypothetical protein [Amphritea pacifica]|uniref:Uncharacterized protein n=1 Tax=Amphritea pacifica TaxID=2811233 RepID=A0ABS2W8I8_9GAMM|nr:hypothetical protein [Amphritea pacifica]MBN0988039.1 hypothetical protein [Amphritea pacifica]